MKFTTLLKIIAQTKTRPVYINRPIYMNDSLEKTDILPATKSQKDSYARITPAITSPKKRHTYSKLVPKSARTIYQNESLTLAPNDAASIDYTKKKAPSLPYRNHFKRYTKENGRYQILGIEDKTRRHLNPRQVSKRDASLINEYNVNKRNSGILRKKIN